MPSAQLPTIKFLMTHSHSLMKASGSYVFSSTSRPTVIPRDFNSPLFGTYVFWPHLTLPDFNTLSSPKITTWTLPSALILKLMLCSKLFSLWAHSHLLPLCYFMFTLEFQVHLTHYLVIPDQRFSYLHSSSYPVLSGGLQFQAISCQYPKCPLPHCPSVLWHARMTTLDELSYLCVFFLEESHWANHTENLSHLRLQLCPQILA